jgi:hypothetical protein
VLAKAVLKAVAAMKVAHLDQLLAAAVVVSEIVLPKKKKQDLEMVSLKQTSQ